MFFTLYGVYIRHFGDEIGLSSVIRLMADFGFSEQAARASLSRLTAQGWLISRKSGRSSYLKITPKGLHRVNEAAVRIYRLQRERWDGRWFLLTYTIPEEHRAIRDQLRHDLSWWGFGTLGTSTWISPHDLSNQITALVSGYGIASYVDYFSAHYHGPESDRELVARCWSLSAVNTYYREFIQTYLFEYENARQLAAQGQLDDRESFIRRTRLVHEYRKFLFYDPALPEELMQEDWAGSQAFQLFQDYDRLLAEGAGRYFYSILSQDPAQKLSPLVAEQGLLSQLDPFSDRGAVWREAS